MELTVWVTVPFAEISLALRKLIIVMLMFGFHLDTDATELLLLTEFLEGFNSLLNIINRSVNCYKVGSRSILRELDSNLKKS